MASKDTTSVEYEAKEDLYVGTTAAHRKGGTFWNNPAQIELLGWGDLVKVVAKAKEDPPPPPSGGRA